VKSELVKCELNVRVEKYGPRVAALALVTNMSKARVDAELRRLMIEVVELRERVGARDELVSELRAKLDRFATPLCARNGRVLCDEVRVASVALAAGLGVALGSVSPAMQVVLDMVEKLRVRGVSFGVDQRPTTVSISNSVQTTRTVSGISERSRSFKLDWKHKWILSLGVGVHGVAHDRETVVTADRRRTRAADRDGARAAHRCRACAVSRHRARAAGRRIARAAARRHATKTMRDKHHHQK
jgi:hypothetical protein